MSGSINLEDIDYVNWIEKKQVWFEREFPWIFQLRTALAKEDIKIDYPHLLIQSGDIWQFVYPEMSPQQIPVLNLNSLLKTASGHGFDEKWLLENVPETKSVTGNPKKKAKNRFVGLKAFEGWLSCFEQVQQSPRMLDSDILLCSLHASTYLAHTRTLTWFSMNNGENLFGLENQAIVLDLLQTEINTTHKLFGKLIELLRLSVSETCSERQELVGKVIENICEIMDIEKKLPNMKFANKVVL